MIPNPVQAKAIVDSLWSEDITPSAAGARLLDGIVDQLEIEDEKATDDGSLSALPTDVEGALIEVLRSVLRMEGPDAAVVIAAERARRKE